MLIALITFPAGARAGDSCTVAYKLSGVLQVTDTYRGKGDLIASNQPGSMVLEFSQDRDGEVTDGKVKVLHFSMFEKIEIDSVVDVTSVTHHFTPACNGQKNPSWRRPTDPGFPKACAYRGGDEPVAVGNLARKAKKISWARCNAPKTYWAKNRDAYVTSDKARGRGCLNELHAVGNVHCKGRLGCRFGGLSHGDNPQNDLWDQPLIHGDQGGDATMIISEDLSKIRTPTGKAPGGFQSINIPNQAPSRTWLSWSGRRDEASRYTTCK
ncbi:MAG: hypothetical protein AAGF92_00035 [Myxococcota bacterium]